MTTPSMSQSNENLQRREEIHDEVWAVLPWYVNQTLSDDEHEMTRKHVSECLVCHREVQSLSALSRSINERHDDPRCEAALKSLHKRLDEDVVPEPSNFPWAAVAMLLLVTGLTSVVSYNVSTTRSLSDSPVYSTLGSRAIQDRFNLMRSARVVFRADVDSKEMIRLLDEIDANVIDGPTNRGAYTIKFPATINRHTQRESIEQLRRTGRVLLAEPVAVNLNERSQL